MDVLELQLRGGDLAPAGDAGRPKRVVAVIINRGYVEGIFFAAVFCAVVFGIGDGCWMSCQNEIHTLTLFMLC